MRTGDEGGCRPGKYWPWEKLKDPEARKRGSERDVKWSGVVVMVAVVILGEDIMAWRRRSCHSRNYEGMSLDPHEVMVDSSAVAGSHYEMNNVWVELQFGRVQSVGSHVVSMRFSSEIQARTEETGPK